MKSFIFFFTLLGLFIFSCGDKKQSQSNLMDSIDEEKKYALTLYGDEVTVLTKGDLLANGKPSALVGVVRKQTDNSFWIQKGSFIQKEKDKWQVILKIEDKISSPNGNLISQVDAKNGYLISFDLAKKPLLINIVMANENGKAASDDAVIKWNSAKNDFEFTAPYEDLPN